MTDPEPYEDEPLADVERAFAEGRKVITKSSYPPSGPQHSALSAGAGNPDSRPRWWLWLLRSNPWSMRSFGRKAAWNYERMIARPTAEDAERFARLSAEGKLPRRVVSTERCGSYVTPPASVQDIPHWDDEADVWSRLGNADTPYEGQQ